MSIDTVKAAIRTRMTTLGFLLSAGGANEKVGNMTDICAEEILADALVFKDHGMLDGLGDDDHTQYHNNARGDARYTPLAHKTTEDAINGLVKVNGAGGYSAVTDNSGNWNTAYSWGNHAGLYTPIVHKTTEDAINGLVKVDGAGSYSAVTDNSGNWNTAYSWGNHAGLYTPIAHKTTEDAINGLVKVDGAGSYSAVTDNSGNWNTAYGWGNHAGLYTPLAHKTTEDAINGLVKVNGAGSYSAVTDNSSNWNTAYSWGNHAGLYTPIVHKTTEDAINGLVKVDGAGSYSAVTDNSGNWNTAYSWGNHAGLYSLAAHLHDGQTLQCDGINSNGGAFSFSTTGAVTFNQNVGIGITIGINGLLHAYKNQAAETKIVVSNPNADGSALLELCGDGGESGTATSRLIHDSANDMVGLEFAYNDLRLRKRGVSEYIKISQASSIYNINTSGSYSLQLGAGGTNSIRATSAGALYFDAANVKMIGGYNYNENIRMHASAINDYSSLILGAVAGDSGTGVGQWALVRFPFATYNYLFSIRYNSTDFLNITSAGDVCINTLTPRGKLHVVKTAGTDSNWYSNAVGVFEHNDDMCINLRSPNNKNGSIVFSDPDREWSGIINYNHVDEVMKFGVNASTSPYALTLSATDVYTSAEQAYSATITGFSSYTYQITRYKRIGKLVFVSWVIQGTSNSTSTYFTAPYTAKTTATGHRWSCNTFT